MTGTTDETVLVLAARSRYHDEAIEEIDDAIDLMVEHMDVIDRQFKNLYALVFALFLFNFIFTCFMVYIVR